MKNKILILILMFGYFGTTTGQVNLSTWEMNSCRGHIPLGTIDMKSQHGNPIAYQLANKPPKQDAGWGPAPTNSAGQVNMVLRSTVPCFQAVDFTYFRAFVDIPETMTTSSFTVTIGNVDDGARMYIYNSEYPNGHFDPATDGRLAGSNFTVDFKDEIVLGEINTIMIVQMDDCASHNNLTGGLTLRVNNNVVQPNPNWTSEHARYVKKNKYAKPAVRFIEKSNWSFKDEDGVDFRIRPDGRAFLIDDGDEIQLSYAMENGKYIFSHTDPEDGITYRMEVTEATKNEMHLKALNGDDAGTTYILGRKRNPNYNRLKNSAWIHDNGNGLREELTFLPDQRIAVEDESSGKEYFANYTLDGNTLTITISEEEAQRIGTTRRTAQVQITRFDYFHLHTYDSHRDKGTEFVREE